jgi:hypothetical protein
MGSHDEQWAGAEEIVKQLLTVRRHQAIVRRSRHH